MAKISDVRAEPGGRVALTFRHDGWTVEPAPSRFGLDDALGLAALGCVAVWFVGVRVDSPPLAWAGVILGVPFFACYLVLVLAQVAGAAWVAGSSLTRAGRRRLRDASRQVDATLNDPSPQARFIPAAVVRAGRIDGGAVGRITVTVTMADGATIRYSSLISREELRGEFGRLLNLGR